MPSITLISGEDLFAVCFWIRVAIKGPSLVEAMNEWLSNVWRMVLVLFLRRKGLFLISFFRPPLKVESSTFSRSSYCGLKPKNATLLPRQCYAHNVKAKWMYSSKVDVGAQSIMTFFSAPGLLRTVADIQWLWKKHNEYVRKFLRWNLQYWLSDEQRHMDAMTERCVVRTRE